MANSSHRDPQANGCDDREDLRLKLETEKMETIARLAGGIAHDFNNLLAVILLHSDLLLTTPVREDSVRRRGGEIRKATERAAALTRQLLAFGSRQVMHPANLDLNREVEKCRELLIRLLGPEVKLTIKRGELLGQISADPVYLEQVIISLAANARDAMPSGGELTLSTESFVCEEDASNLTLTPGPYARLTMTDTGSGMDEATQNRIFEPFFTTKAPGQGKGLGLSAVYGIVKQFAGEIRLHSERGRGTSLEIYLPLANISGSDSLDEDTEELLEGTETVLLVDDESLVRRAIGEMLDMYGYNVLEAESGPEAIEVCKECDEPIDLLLTDVTLPGMNGPAVAKEISQRQPGIRILLMSGFTDPGIVGEGLADGLPFIEKPFTPETLARRIRQILDAEN